MRLNGTQAQALIDARFSGNILYMPVHTDDSTNPRAAAQVTRHPSIAPFSATTEPRSLIRDHSALHLKGILHHNPLAPSLKG